ncbi:LysM peptidoglycan-binding domain-containing protein [Sandaracinus amylolyticus]|uniref:LysM peptidoglycan-binding domain-containing protein n=1 Tax=Sandaracinus amylolyticus TaxID=927083 RepID=UPI0009F8BB4B|nr:LysM peptidoglycan-binding domain-containing protein [Sandaracinus amylolyticus]
MRWVPSIAAVGAALALIALVACGGAEETQPDAGLRPVEAAPVEPTVEAASDEPPAGIDHTVGEGETLWDIARAYGVGVEAIMAANRLRDRDVRRLRRGMVLRIPGASAPVVVETAEQRAAAAAAPLPEIEGAAWHRIAEGETLWDVATLYEVSAAAILERNELDDDAVRLLRPGQPIQVPGITSRDVERAAERAAREAPSRREPRGFRHTVQRGETIWSLAGSFGVSVAEIMAANRLSPDEASSLREGATLYVPGVERDTQGRMRRVLSGAQQRALAAARRLGMGSHQAGSALLHGRVQPTWLREASRGFGRDRLPGSLRWPVANGWFVRGYGSGEGGYHLATDIMGEIGWNVRASAPGVVGYAGDEIPGYGNTVLIVHPGGWVTMYAHNSVNFVVAGERVPAGAIIAEVGSTGISRGPHVHFELIFQGQNCDPAALWRPGIRHRNGSLTPMDPLTWNDVRQRPSGIRCHARMRHPRSRWVIHEEL